MSLVAWPLAITGAVGGRSTVRVTVDLSQPVTTITDGDLVPPVPPDDRLRSGAIMEPGDPPTFTAKANGQTVVYVPGHRAAC